MTASPVGNHPVDGRTQDPAQIELVGASAKPSCCAASAPAGGAIIMALLVKPAGMSSVSRHRRELLGLGGDSGLQRALQAR
jgi:hypothetical protein